MEKKYKNKKYRGLVLLLLLISIFFIGGIFAYFSDMISDNKDAKTGTLDVNGSYTFYLDGNETLLGDIKNLNPGDVIVVKANISNVGNKSAWIREKISFSNTDESILNHIEVYEGLYTRQELKNNNLSQYKLASFNNSFLSTNKVINGQGEANEIESGSDFNYLNNYEYEIYYTIYFAPSATNDAQGKTFNISIATQALQFRNNNDVEPNELSWGTVVSLT